MLQGDRVPAARRHARTPRSLRGETARVPALLDAWTDVVRDGIAGVTSPRVVVERSIDQLERVLALGAVRTRRCSRSADGDDAAQDRVVEAVRDEVTPRSPITSTCCRNCCRTPVRRALGAARRRGALRRADPELDDAAGARGMCTNSASSGSGRSRRSAGRSPSASAIPMRTPRSRRTGRRAATPPPPRRCWSTSRRTRSRAMDAAPRYFGRLPRSACEVRLVEAFHEADQPFAYYWPPSGDGGRPGSTT